MNQTIRSRIEQIKRGEIPEGYEKTPFGIFPCDWEKDKSFKELFSFFGGLGKSREELGTNGTCYLHYGDMHTGNFTKVSYAQYLDKPKYEIKISGEESFLMKDGDIAFLDASEDLEGTSRAVLIDNPENKPFIAGLHTILAKEKQNALTKNYKQYISIPQYVKKQFQRLAVGFKVYGLNRETFNKVKISFPKSKAEQDKIAEILQEQDRLIKLKEKLIEEKKKQKQYLMEALLTGKVRLPGFTDEWITDTLKNHILILNGFAFQSSSYEREGKFKVITIKNVKENSFNTEDCDKISVLPEGIQTHQLLKIGDILMSLTGNVGRVCIVNEEDCLLNQRVAKVVCLNQNETGWIVQMLNRKHFVVVMQNCSSGAAQANLSVGCIYDYAFASPKNNEEKIAISNILIKADEEIKLLQKELEEQKRKKQSLMQLLLTGIVRVKA